MHQGLIDPDKLGRAIPAPSQASNNGSLPFSADAEKGVLCSLILAPDKTVDLCSRLLKPAYFYAPAHQIVYKVLLEWPGNGKIEFPWLKEEIKKRGQLEEVGGIEFLDALFDFLQTGSNPGYYIDMVIDAWARRSAILESRRRESAAYDLKATPDQYDPEGRFTIAADKAPLIEFLSPSEIVSYKPPAGVLLVGDNHITRGSVFVIGGAPGVGKSRASVALAEAGATGYDWFGLKTHCRFKTLIVQNENGRFRLKQEFSSPSCTQLDQYVRICPPPPFGLCFDRSEFRDQLSEAIDIFDPGVIAIDPWNAISRDEKARTMLETFELIRSVIPAGDSGPAIGINAHTRKPQAGERSPGRALLNLLAGSYVLGSVPRCVFVMQAASDDVMDGRIVWTCCKNNDGELGQRSAWTRCNGLFESVPNFDWEAFDSAEKNDGPTWDKVAEIVRELGDKASRKTIVQELKERGASSPTAYRHIEKAEKQGAIRLNKRTGIYEVKQ